MTDRARAEMDAETAALMLEKVAQAMEAGSTSRLTADACRELKSVIEQQALDVAAVISTAKADASRIAELEAELARLKEGLALIVDAEYDHSASGCQNHTDLQREAAELLAGKK